MKRILLPVLGVLALLAALLIPTGPASATVKVKCKQTTGTAAVDPIMAHNVDGPSSHVHAFFGNNGWLAKGNAANYGDLTGQGTNCDEAGDTAGYWQPILVDTRTGEQLPARTFTAYYRTFDSKDTGAGRAFPPDTRLVAMANSDSPGASGWSCGQKSSVSGQTTIPDCSSLSQRPGEVLTVHISFPSCWDGVAPNHKASDVGVTNDNAHYAYPVRSSRGWACPSAFPVEMVQLRETLQYPNPDKVPARYLAVSSDPVMGGHNGSSMHGDFWNAWDQSRFESVVCSEVNGGRNCAGSDPTPTPTPTPTPSSSPTPTPTATSTGGGEDHPWCDAHPGRCGHKHHHGRHHHR